MAEHRAPITDFVATDDSGGFINTRTGEVRDVAAMLSVYGRDELMSVPIGRRPPNFIGQHMFAALPLEEG